MDNVPNLGRPDNLTLPPPPRPPPLLPRSPPGGDEERGGMEIKEERRKEAVGGGRKHLPPHTHTHLHSLLPLFFFSLSCDSSEQPLKPSQRWTPPPNIPPPPLPPSPANPPPNSTELMSIGSYWTSRATWQHPITRSFQTHMFQTPPPLPPSTCLTSGSARPDCHSSDELA